jgi:hypothetical protein
MYVNWIYSVIFDWTHLDFYRWLLLWKTFFLFLVGDFMYGFEVLGVLLWEMFLTSGRNFWLGRCLYEIFYWAFATWEWSIACQYKTVMRAFFCSNYDSLCAIIFDRYLSRIYDECGIRSSACQYKMRECNQLICQTVLNFYDWLPTFMSSSWACECF